MNTVFHDMLSTIDYSKYADKMPFLRQIPTSKLLVRCGDWDVSSNDERIQHQDRKVESLSIHPSYGGRARVYYNFAIIHVTQEFELNEYINPVCLPSIPNQRDGKNTYNHPNLITVIITFKSFVI